MNTCPQTAEDWKRAEITKNCSSGIYHCLRILEPQTTLEVCAPSNTMIQKGGCPYWNIFGNVERVDCSIYPECPDKPFLSNEVYKHPFCYKPWSKLTTIMTTEISLSSFYSTSTAAMNEIDNSEKTWLSVLFYFLSCVDVVMLIFSMACYYIRKRRQLQKKDHNDPEQQPVNAIDYEEPTEEPTSATPFLPEVEVNDETGFIRSEAYKEGLEAIKKYHVVLIIGSPGSGKTATGNEILFTYRKRNWKYTTLDGLQKADLDQLNFNLKQVIFVDNCFGYWTSDLPETRLLQIRDKLKFLFINGFKRPGDTKLILSIGKVAYSKHKGYLKSVPGLLESRTIDLDSDGNFSSAQKEYMINNCLAYLESVRDGIDNEKLKETLSDSSSNDGIGFPLKVQLLLQLNNLPVQDFLQNTLGCLIKHFEEMQTSESESDKLDYAALVYVMLKGRFSDKCKLDRWCSERLYGLYGEQSLKRQLQRLDGKYLRRDHENFYVFAHGILHIAVFHAFYHDDPECLLEHCNVDAILELVRSSTQAPISDPFVVNLKIADFPVLAERIAQMHLELYFVDHQLQETKIFKEMFDLRLKISQLDNKFSGKERRRLEKIEKETMAVDNKETELKKAIKKSRIIADDNKRKGIEWCTHRAKYKELVDYVRR